MHKHQLSFCLANWPQRYNNVTSPDPTLTSVGARLLDVLEAEAAVVELHRRVAALVGVGVHVNGERLDVTC